MARKSIRKYRRRTRWSSNIKEINAAAIATSQGAWSGSETLATNPAQDVLGVSQVYTVKNFDINFTIEASGTDSRASIEGVTAYIMYVPQGMTITETYPNYHPEYIMGCRFYGSPENEQTGAAGIRNPLSIRSRLARRLQTGDKIVFLLVGTNSGTTNVTIDFNGLLRWWTKAN